MNRVPIAIETGLTSPVWEYSHDLGISITGGFVYRGDLAPSLTGRYVFADYGTGRIWALAWDGSDAAVEADHGYQPRYLLLWGR